VQQVRYGFEVPNPYRDRWDRPCYQPLAKAGRPEDGEQSAFDQEGKNDLKRVGKEEEGGVVKEGTGVGFKKKKKKKKKGGTGDGDSNGDGAAASAPPEPPAASTDVGTTLSSMKDLEIANHGFTPLSPPPLPAAVKTSSQQSALAANALRFRDTCKPPVVSKGDLSAVPPVSEWTYAVDILCTISVQAPLSSNSSTSVNVQSAADNLNAMYSRKEERVKEVGVDGWEAWEKFWRSKGASGKEDEAWKEFASSWTHSKE